MNRYQLLIAFIFLFVDGIVAKNVLLGYKAPEAKRPKSDIPVPGRALKPIASGTKEIYARAVRNHPLYTTFNTMGHCLTIYAACRSLGKCEVHKNKHGYRKSKNVLSKITCKECESTKKTCLIQSKRYKQHNINECLLKEFYCHRKCGHSYRCRAGCRSPKAQCIAQIRNPPGYYQMLKRRKENKA